MTIAYGGILKAVLDQVDGLPPAFSCEREARSKKHTNYSIHCEAYSEKHIDHKFKSDASRV